MANWLALRLDRLGKAEMSCIAGIGGGVEPLLRKGRSADLILGLDGCSLACVKHCLKRENLNCDLHWDLSQMGVAKKYHEDFDFARAEEIAKDILADLETRLARHDP